MISYDIVIADIILTHTVIDSKSVCTKNDHEQCEKMFLGICMIAIKYVAESWHVTCLHMVKLQWQSLCVWLFIVMCLFLPFASEQRIWTYTWTVFCCREWRVCGYRRWTLFDHSLSLISACPEGVLVSLTLDSSELVIHTVL